MPDIEATIYVIRNTKNKKIYIGSTIQTVKERMQNHKDEATANRKNMKLIKAMRKLGTECFSIEVLEHGVFDDMDHLHAREEHLIQKHNSRRMGYNMRHSKI